MTPNEILSVAKQRGIILKVEGDQIKYKAPVGTMTPDLIEAIKNQKSVLLRILCKTEIAPGRCENCPAGGFWDHKGTGRWCFHTAYFLGKPGQPTKCEDAQSQCPLANLQSEHHGTDRTFFVKGKN